MQAGLNLRAMLNIGGPLGARDAASGGEQKGVESSGDDQKGEKEGACNTTRATTNTANTVMANTAASNKIDVLAMLGRAVESGDRGGSAQEKRRNKKDHLTKRRLSVFPLCLRSPSQLSQLPAPSRGGRGGVCGVMQFVMDEPPDGKVDANANSGSSRGGGGRGGKGASGKRSRAQKGSAATGVLPPSQDGGEAGSCEAVLTLHNGHDVPIAFRVKSTTPARYAVRPSCGVVGPGQVTVVQVLLPRAFFVEMMESGTVLKPSRLPAGKHGVETDDLFLVEGERRCVRRGRCVCVCVC